MRKEIITLLVVSTFLINCNNDSKKKNLQVSENITSHEKVKEEKGICDNYKSKGSLLIACKSWKDKLGDNAIIFSKNIKGTEKVEFFAELVKNNSNSSYLNIYDFIENCPVDFDINYIENSLSITDLDSDNIKEICFLYELACQGGIGPTTMKLMMIEADQKYKIRGLRKDEVSIRNPDIAINYDKSIIDKSFYKAPKKFLSFAQKKWEQNYGTKLRENISTLRKIQKVKSNDEGIATVTLSDNTVIKFEDPSPSFYNLSSYKIQHENIIVSSSGDSYGNEISIFLKLDSKKNEFYVTKVIVNFVLKQKSENNLKICTIDNINIPLVNYDSDEIYEKLTEAEDCIIKTQ
ncbi:hypothetical protein HN014_15830 [Aquimarina sp. TRL1]|uniref:M949_RS01915 family surface polysaccharide biosynthesis protein n=1 Tax=Aquimarina sp. (strain TRL1) TaxID=2736252 RepID=UPI00158983E8|nr:hypothetical protein [Aquimarina sp. TRL1]QKX06318.1 hypothetical protein HN014_15830 [Aquimarina sp. TRL1]